jgi:hypothetical protein
MSFGKDYRLVGEATVTGEKFGAGTTFWSSLVHTDIIGRIRLMVEHYAIVGKYIGQPLVYDREELIAWLTDRSSNCLKCYPYYVDDEKMLITDQPRFISEFFSKMKEIGLGWMEFRLYYGRLIDKYFQRNTKSLESDWDEKEIFRSEPRPGALFDDCITPQRFVDVLDEIVANRRRIHELPVARAVPTYSYK